MSAKPKCAWCGKVIPHDRVIIARSRGMEPKYCSNTCRGNANTAAYRERKREE